MSPRSNRRTYRRTSGQRSPFGFLRKPVVQLSILGIAALVIFLIASTGGK